MKTLAFLSVVAALAVAVDHHWSEISKALNQSAKTLATAAPSVEKLAESIKLGPAATRSSDSLVKSSINEPAGEDARKFVIRVDFVNRGGDLVAYGDYYNVPPSLSTHPETLDPRDQALTYTGSIYVSGVPNDGRLVRGTELTYWMVEDGNKSCVVVPGGAPQSFRAYRVVGEPLNLPPKPGVWMTLHGRTSLDKPAHR